MKDNITVSGWVYNYKLPDIKLEYLSHLTIDEWMAYDIYLRKRGFYTEMTLNIFDYKSISMNFTKSKYDDLLEKIYKENTLRENEKLKEVSL